ncbi:MAG: DUF1232 domain-containing protein [Rhodospirillales bacterium]|nr:DUF1232 domain-containing protein [Rhodospirillales bacterium]
MPPFTFWRKIRLTLRVVPFLEDAVAAWYCARDPATPLRAKAVLVGALAYFVIPIDVIPDILGVLGYGDDMAVLYAALRAVRPHITGEHRDHARRILRRHSGDEVK